ncbi:hypothetical protein BDY24DRAFT_415089 [Mrakia frigida]|uniref:uncharacterized protein n=1 Tax=Mrakia frigida TaxID=29902 RepID=UPI003FCC132A
MPFTVQRKVRTYTIIPHLFYVSFRGMKPHFFGKSHPLRPLYLGSSTLHLALT